MDQENTNQKKTIPDDVIRLQLTYKGLTEFPDYLLTENVYKAVNLLYLGRNLISKLPENLGNLSSLTGLFINHNKLQHLPEAISRLDNLQSLNLTGNELLELPDSLRKLKKLQKLEICNNQLTKLPSGIGNLLALRILEVANNNLTTVPTELSNCEHLETLNLDNNRLIFLPRQFRKLGCLCELSAAKNNLYALPQEIGRNECFKSLYVDNNQSLYSLPSSVNGKDVGFFRCAEVLLPAEILDHFPHVNIQHTLTEKLSILLPPELQQVLNMQSCVPSLLELALRVASDNIHHTDIKEAIPFNLWSLMECSTSCCEECKKDIFLSAFPVVLKKHTHSQYILGMCCSLNCVKKFHQHSFLPLVYPSLEDMCLALMPI